MHLHYNHVECQVKWSWTLGVKKCQNLEDDFANKFLKDRFRRRFFSERDSKRWMLSQVFLLFFSFWQMLLRRKNYVNQEASESDVYIFLIKKTVYTKWPKVLTPLKFFIHVDDDCTTIKFLAISTTFPRS